MEERVGLRRPQRQGGQLSQGANSGLLEGPGLTGSALAAH